ncbi:MAG: hypothetical protein MJZ19_05395 [Paludibacteraceae bacterium]|nr:hypothetical protein [Paludibacteraceae bacterium]
MDSWSWGDFLSIWLPFCIIIDVVFIVLNKTSGKSISSQEEERKAKTKSLNTQFVDNVEYATETRSISMKKVEVLKPKAEILPDPFEVEGKEIKTDIEGVTQEGLNDMEKLLKLYNMA